MNREETLTFLKGQLAAKIVSPEDIAALGGVLRVAPAPESAPADASPAPQGIMSMRLSITNAFYGIGAVIVLAGIGILIAQYWNDIGFAGRMLATAGIATSTFIAGMLFREREQRVIAEVMFTIAAALGPIGVGIALHEGGINFTIDMQIATAASFCVIFGAAYFANRTRPILVPLMAAFALWAYYAVIAKAYPGLWGSYDIIRYAAMLAGLSLLLVGYGYRPADEGDKGLAKEQGAVRRIFYGFGALAILWPGITFGGMGDLIFIGTLFAGFYLSVYLQSRTMLTLSALFLIAHIIKLTGKYFAGSVGWPVALVVAGFLIIAAGYGTFALNKNYFPKR